VDSPQFVLETERLRLRRMSLDDLDFVAEMLAHPEVMRFYPKCHTRSESAEWIERQLARYEKDGHGLWLTLERQSGVPVGQIGLTIQQVDGCPEPEVGWLLHHPYWKRGFATEAALASRDYAFRQLGLARVISLIRPVNTPSQAVARRIGMQPGRRAQHGGYEHIVFETPGLE
jgi:RimJ/RimL family protein N-acetyltransferase